MKTQLINGALLALFFRKHRVLLIVLTLCTAGYSLMTISLWPMMTDEALLEMMSQLAESMPGLDDSAFTMTLGQYYESQWLGVYWLPLSGATLIVFAAKAIGGSVSDGSLELYCAAPLRRGTYVRTALLALLLAALLFCAATMLPLVLLGPAFEAALEPSTALLLTLACFCILAVFGLFVLAVSAWVRGVGLAAGAGVAFIVLMLVLSLLTSNVEALELLKYFNLFYWWGAGGIIDTGEAQAGLWLWLAVVGAASLALATWGFLRRDLT